MLNVNIYGAAFIVAAAIFAGCSKQNRDAASAPKFDAKHIATEADKGNLGPLKELNAACSAEVEENGKRLSVCNTQDEVRKLSKPINVRL